MSGRLCLAVLLAGGLGLAACGSSHTSPTVKQGTTTTIPATTSLQLVGTPAVFSDDYVLPNNVTGWATAVVAYVRNAGNAPINHANFLATVLSSSGRTEAVSSTEDFSIRPGATRPIVYTTDDPRGDRPASATVQLIPPTSSTPRSPAPSAQSRWLITTKNLDCGGGTDVCTATATFFWQGAAPQSATATVTLVVHQGGGPSGPIIGAGERPLISGSGGGPDTVDPNFPISWADNTVVIDKQYRNSATGTSSDFWVDSFDASPSS